MCVGEEARVREAGNFLLLISANKLLFIVGIESAKRLLCFMNDLLFVMVVF